MNKFEKIYLAVCIVVMWVGLTIWVLEQGI